ncbi:bacteriohemerythrin [Magnetovibrio sp.]|uniref:bacteriohemerythrin n=1 Tax=Magnetovibrio sp. TaxID=2024836 RepID=UPI002F92A558
MLMQWSKALEIGHPIIDYDHQMLVNIANDLHHAVHANLGDQMIAQSLQRLVQYIETHFAREEELFSKTRYPHVEKHKQNHRDIEKLVHGFLTAFEADPNAVDMNKLLGFMKEWLIKHIGKLDKSYASYVIKSEKSSTLGQRRGFA